ncbi:uncharacterized protein LOC132747964 [Ruditapes philippinarum]|uniref:uncharacterized protein LOC132747964 n=1 Tax=Ruditapes philippinarum TaxID=129788 RepID=UPI00295ACF49|nr:uncharacterized protein LOC132747964 [Ruditapes philippinarum]
MMKTYDKRVKELDEKKKQCLELQGKLNLAKSQCDKLGREIDDQKRKFNKQSLELFDTKNALEKLQTKNKEMHDKIAELTSKIKYLQSELKELNRTPTPPPTPSPPPSPEKVYVKVVDSSTELKLKEVEEELEGAKSDIEKYFAELQKVKDLYRAEQEKNKGLMARITILEKEAQERPTTNVPEPPVAEQVKLPDGQDKDVSYVKTLMTGMKKDFEAELEKVKSHVKKEKARGDASIKKMEFLHKDQLTSIHKDSLRMLRGIMHFREHMMVCFEKENLADQAQALQELGDIKDKLSPDPKDMLAALVGIVVDYLNKMEGILSNAFLALRVLMKYQVDKQVEAEVQHRLAMKEVQRKARAMKEPKKNVNSLAKSLKKAKNKLKNAKQNTKNFATDRQYLDLLSRYNNMMKLYQGMQRDMEVLQGDFHDTMQKKLEEQETIMISQIKMEKKQKRAQVDEHLKMSIADQKQNLKILSIAYEQNKISKKTQMMGTAMIQKTMEIPRRKLKTLFEKYITYRTIKDSKERVARVLSDEKMNLSDDTREDMEQYIHTIDGKFRQSMKKWKEEMQELDQEKMDLHKRIYNLFNEALVERGVLFVHPLLRDQNKTENITKAASMMNRKRLQHILFKRKQLCKDILHLPDEILGKAVTLGQGDNKFWNRRVTQERVRGSESNIVLPHMVVYDVNKPRIEASRTFCRGRQTYDLGRAESFDICQQNYVQYIRDSAPYDLLWNTTVCIA